MLCRADEESECCQRELVGCCCCCFGPSGDGRRVCRGRSSSSSSSRRSDCVRTNAREAAAAGTTASLPCGRRLDSRRLAAVTVQRAEAMTTGSRSHVAHTVAIRCQRLARTLRRCQSPPLLPRRLRLAGPPLHSRCLAHGSPRAQPSARQSAPPDLRLGGQARRQHLHRIPFSTGSCATASPAYHPRMSGAPPARCAALPNLLFL